MTYTNTSIMPQLSDDDQITDFHEDMPWLPPYILNDSSDSGEDDYRLFSKRRNVVNDGLEACGENDHRFYSSDGKYDYRHKNQPHSGRKSPAAAQAPLLPSPPRWKNYSKPDQKLRNSSNWSAGGPGMQAVFLVSGQKPCGTGVFLPRTTGTDVEKPRKPAFAPILLPSRVVQALNLNVHGLGSQIKPREHNNNVKGLECDRVTRTKKNKDMSSQICVISQNRSSSPEIFLPKEWTY